MDKRRRSRGGASPRQERDEWKDQERWLYPMPEWDKEEAAEKAELRSVAGISRAIAKAIIGLLVTLIGTGIISMATLYVKVATLTDSVTATSQTLKKHLTDSVSEKQYQRDQAAIYESIRQMATKEEFRSLQKQMDDQTSVLRKIEDRLTPAYPYTPRR